MSFLIERELFIQDLKIKSNLTYFVNPKLVRDPWPKNQKEN